MNALQEFLFGIEKIVNIVFLFIRNSLRTPTQCQRAVELSCVSEQREQTFEKHFPLATNRA